jgi:hypothetical protein
VGAMSELQKRKAEYYSDLELCIRSMLYVFKKMDRKTAEKECRKYIKISLGIYSKRV